jgi:hypothetical protein
MRFSKPLSSVCPGRSALGPNLFHAQRESTILTIEFHSNAGIFESNPYRVAREH